MPIETNNLVIYESERLTDTSDGGGKYNGKTVQDGISNNLFDDVSELDRTMGNVSMRKVFAGVTSADTSALMGATVFISENPVDPNVSALLFSTKSFTDTRDSAQNRVENYLVKGGLATGAPIDTHWQGMKLLQVMMFPEELENVVGDTLALIANEGKGNAYQQFVRITSVETRKAILVVEKQKIEYKIATYSLNNPLERDFIGLSAMQWFQGNPSTTTIRETLVADTGRYYSSTGIKKNVAVASTTIHAQSMFKQLVPASQVETPLIDLSITGTSKALIGAANTLTRSITTTVGTSQSTYIGSSILPSSVSFSLDGNQITDNAGELKTIAGVSVGTINYDSGLINWNNGSGSGSKSFDFKFTPAAVRTRVSNSDFFEVTQNSQSLNLVKTILPAPTRGSFVLNFTSQGKTYVVTDNGTGVLSGTIQGIATGTIDYVTGSMLVTFSALPDVGTDIVWYWADNLSTEDITAKQDIRLGIEYLLAKPFDKASPVTLEWKVGSDNKTANVSSDGVITGDATGTLADRKLILKPNALYPLSTEVKVNYRQLSQGTTDTATYALSEISGTEIINGETFKKYGFNIGTGKTVNELSFVVLMRSTKNLLEYSYSEAERLIEQPFKYQAFGTDIYLMDLLTNKSVRKVGTVNYATGDVVFTGYAEQDAYQRVVNTSKGYYQIQTTGVERRKAAFAPVIPPDNLIKITCTTVSNANAANVSEAVERKTGYHLNIVKNIGFSVAQESVFFRASGTNYYVNNGAVYTQLNPSTGVGVIVGTYDQSSNRIELSTFAASGENQVNWQSIMQVVDSMPIASAVFKIPIAPVRPMSFQLLVGTPAQINVTADEDGNINHSKVKGKVNYENGTVKLSFTEVSQNVSQEILNDMKIKYPWLTEDFYKMTAQSTYTVTLPSWFSANDIRYNAVGYSYIPLDAEILGLSATRLPLDGRVPIFRVGDIGIISSSKSKTLDSAVAGQIYQLNDVRISYCELEDSKGKKLSYDQYVVDYDYGKVTLSGDYTSTGLVLPLIAKYRYHDMGLINDVQIDGRITFTKPVTHNYDAAHTTVGSALVIGDMQSRYTTKFIQGAWNNTWSDTASGASISANYNDALYPIAVSNKGAIQERWAIVFTDATNFRCIGEYSGQIASGNINSDFSPINPTTGAFYFVIKKEGWGSGWASGNVLRFNTIAAMFPIWAIRCVKQSEPTVMSDQFQIMLRGDIDRVI